MLAKIDVDANPRISQALQVQSIPSVFAVIGGQLIPGFQGALPEAQVREFVDAVLQAGREAGLTGGGAPSPHRTRRRHRRRAAGRARGPAVHRRRGRARGRRLRAGRPALPGDPRQRAGQQGGRAGAGPDAAAQAARGVDPTVAQRAQAAPDDVDAQLAAADLAFAGNDIGGALDRLLGTIARSAADDRERVRMRLLEYFDLLGPDDPRVADPPAAAGAGAVLMARRREDACRPARGEDRVRHLVAVSEGDPLAPFALRPEKSYAFAPDGARGGGLPGARRGRGRRR